MRLAALHADDWPALSTLLDEALALPASEREAFVDALGSEHAARREVLRTLLSRAPALETNDFLRTLPHGALPSAPPAGGQPEPGAEIGPYRLIEELGAGGMGAVWLAERRDGSPRRKVALKLPRLSWDPSLAARSLRERDILAALEHPHIARLYDAGVDALGRPYLAMEYVQGQPIDAWCDARRLSLASRVDLLRQVADAVAYAHRRLVVHRDLKPSNILVTDQGQVRLLDFGIARLLDADAAQAGETTVAAPAFTVNYASPEQLQGLALGTSTDIYSLGVVAHELLCGRRPHAHLPERGMARVQAILAAEPAPPSRIVPTAAQATARASTPWPLQRALRGDLDAILLRALARQPELRYPSAEALADDLARWRDGRPVAAQRPRPAYLLRKFVSRHRLGVGASAAAVVALTVTASLAVLQGRHAQEQAQRAQASRDFLVRLFERADPELRGGRPATVRELLEPAEREAAQLPPAQQREVLATLSRLWESIDDNPRAAQVQAQLSALLAAQPAGDEGLALAEARVGEARLAVFMDLPDKAERLLEAAGQAMPSAQWPPRLQALAGLLRGQVALYRGAGAPAQAQLAAAATAARTLDEPALEADALSVLQFAHVQLRQPEQVLVVQRALAVVLGDTRLAPRVRQNARGLMLEALEDIGRYADGWALAQQVVAEHDRLYPEAPRPALRQRLWWLRLGLTLGHHGVVVAWLRQHDPSPAQLAEYEAEFPAFELAQWHRVTARVWAVAGDAPRAERELERGRRQITRMPVERQAVWRLPMALTAAHVALGLGQPEAALALLERLVQDPALPAVLRPHVEWAGGVTQALRGRPGDAAEWLRRAEHGFAALGEPAPPGLAAVRLNLALLALGGAPAQPDDVRRWLQHAERALPEALGAEHPAARLARSLGAAAPTAGTPWPARLSAARRQPAAHPPPLVLF
jgi:serine/threonine protein kinase